MKMRRKFLWKRRKEGEVPWSNAARVLLEKLGRRKIERKLAKKMKICSEGFGSQTELSITIPIDIQENMIRSQIPTPLFIDGSDHKISIPGVSSSKRWVKKKN